MSVAAISAMEMFDAVEAAVNGTDFEAGKTDAIVHVGQLITGEKTPEHLSDVQDALADTGEDYALGYQAAWRELYTFFTSL